MRFIVSTLPTLLVLCGTAAVSAEGNAPQRSSHEQATLELFEALKMESTFEATLEASLQQVVQQNPQLVEYMDVMREFFRKYMSWGSLEDEMAQVYMKAFTEKEMRQLIAFYRTPIGKKAAQTVPQLAADGMAIGQRRVQANMGELQQMIQARQQELNGGVTPPP